MKIMIVAVLPALITGICALLGAIAGPLFSIGYNRRVKSLIKLRKQLDDGDSLEEKKLLTKQIDFELAKHDNTFGVGHLKSSMCLLLCIVLILLGTAYYSITQILRFIDNLVPGNFSAYLISSKNLSNACKTSFPDKCNSMERNYVYSQIAPWLKHQMLNSGTVWFYSLSAVFLLISAAYFIMRLISLPGIVKRYESLQGASQSDPKLADESHVSENPEFIKSNVKAILMVCVTALSAGIPGWVLVYALWFLGCKGKHWTEAFQMISTTLLFAAAGASFIITMFYTERLGKRYRDMSLEQLATVAVGWLGLLANVIGLLTVAGKITAWAFVIVSVVCVIICCIYLFVQKEEKRT
ncbi:hypothetical protein OZX62_05235 [Bifidobacterium sp. ESL0690]|uniref:hypothetical protein n=1 Tax=Bifidobacterium sp. ESL0690 TaxID=2983214 RepID=UPI0023F99D73|nr:hypothetical protein [Bifidobacterium sp. ESL0690]WEV47664.1 hypothetical protein OZX62_05235 [Bifidobacterium sp. ESL0690]